MSSMTQSFALSSDINIARFYWRIFEEIQSSPVPPRAYVLGEILAGMIRGMSAAAVVVGLGMIFGLWGHLGGLFWLAVALNAFFFSNAAVAVAMLVRSHGDQALLSNFVITPMAFLGGTFFPVERLPDWARLAVDLIPLTPCIQDHPAGLSRAAGGRLAACPFGRHGADSPSGWPYSSPVGPLIKECPTP